MRKSVSRILALGAFFVVAGTVAACGSGVPGNSVADVAGNPISTAAFDHWMYVAAKSQGSQTPGAPVIVPNDPPSFSHCVAQVRRQVPSLAKTPTKTIQADCKQLFTSLSSQVMDFLIKAYWYQAEAARTHVTVTNAQVQDALNKAKAQQFATPAQFQGFLAQTGETLSDVLFRFRINQIYTKLLARHQSAVTAAAVQRYYQTHLSQFGTPESRNIRIVLASTAAQVGAAKKALQSGKSWNEVAKKYSLDPTSKNYGGLLVGVRQGQEDAALDRAAFAAPVGQLVGPVRGQFGYYLVDVTKINPSAQETLAQATPLIRQTLTGEQQTAAQTALDNGAKKHWLSQTSCRSAYAMVDCSGYKTPKTSTSATSTTG
jgi:foldase protein PrsA